MPLCLLMFLPPLPICCYAAAAIRRRYADMMLRLLLRLLLPLRADAIAYAANNIRGRLMLFYARALDAITCFRFADYC